MINFWDVALWPDEGFQSLNVWILKSWEREVVQLLFSVFVFSDRHVQNKCCNEKKNEKNKQRFPAKNKQNCNTFQNSVVLDIAPLLLLLYPLRLLFFPSSGFYGATDILAGSRWILATKRRWRTFITWCWRATRTGPCRMPSPYREPKSCSTLSRFPRCCLSMSSSPSCMTNIPSMYDNSTEPAGRNVLIPCTYA